MDAIMPMKRIENHIYLIRGQKVLLDAYLAELYQVKTGHLNLAVRRNPDRFPPDFAFQLTLGELASLKFILQSQVGAGDDIYPMRLHRREWACFLAFSGLSVPRK